SPYIPQEKYADILTAFTQVKVLRIARGSSIQPRLPAEVPRNLSLIAPHFHPIKSASGSIVVSAFGFRQKCATIRRANSLTGRGKLAMRRLFVLILLLVPGWVFPPASEPANRKTDVVYDVQDPVSIKTRDGASISAIVVRKKQETKALPVILFYTTYVFGPDDASIAKKSVDKGYVGIIAYSRGIRTNLADYVPYEHDGRDIYDVIEWITKQPWCDGKVAMYGGSYTGYSQWATAKALHPALKTIVPQAAVMPGYDTPIENNVCASFLCFSWPNDVLQNKPLPQDLFPRWFAAGASYRSLDAFAGQPNRIFQKWLQHPAYDDYWKSMIPSAQEFARLKIPVLTTTGYYDGAQIGAIKYLKLHYEYNKAADHYLVMGPYSHRGAQRNADANLMGYQLDASAVVN